jgi:predicted NBD/HSP70 family sugar kinase
MKKRGTAIAIDIGGTSIKSAIVYKNEILEFVKTKTPKEKLNFLKELYHHIERFSDKKIKNIGISCAGVVSEGKVFVSPNLPIKNFNLKSYLQKKFPKKKFEIENDGSCAVLAESKFTKNKNLIVITLGTGIGGGILIDGKIYKGKGFAGEIGHFILDNKKDFEELASPKSIMKSIKKTSPKKFSKNSKTEEIKKFLNEKTKQSREIKSKITDYLGQGIAGLTTILDPDEIILTGGLTKLGKPFLNEIKSKTKKYSFLPREPKIKISKLKNPEILGASFLLK